MLLEKQCLTCLILVRKVEHSKGFYNKNLAFVSSPQQKVLFSSLQVSLKIEEQEIEHALKDKALVGNILATGLP